MTSESTWDNTQSKQLNGLLKFLKNYDFKTQDEAIQFVTEYAKERYNYTGSSKECAQLIQKDFQSFFKVVRDLKSKPRGKRKRRYVPREEKKS